MIDHFVSAYGVEHVDYSQRDLFPRDVETAFKALHNHVLRRFQRQDRTTNNWRNYGDSESRGEQSHAQAESEDASVESSVTSETASNRSTGGGSVSQQSHMHVGLADRSGGPSSCPRRGGINGWNMAQFGGRKQAPRSILRTSRIGQSPQDLMANWQVQLDAVKTAKEEAVTSGQSSNVQVGREVAVMHSQAHPDSNTTTAVIRFTLIQVIRYRKIMPIMIRSGSVRMYQVQVLTLAQHSIFAKI